MSIQLHRRRCPIRPCLEELERRELPSALGSLSPAVRNLAAVPIHHTTLVHPDESIQAAVNAARPGTTVLLEPGVYHQSVRIGTPDLTLAGLGGAVLANPGRADDGIVVTPAGRGVTLANLTIRGFADNGVVLEAVHGLRISHVTATDDGDYGLFPIACTGGVIEGCSASGHRDTGIYVGQSAAVTIRDCTAFDNVNGIEVENSRDVRVFDSRAYGNTAGVLIDLLPGLPVQRTDEILVRGNRVNANNRPNDADPHDIASAIPPGVGILVLGAKHTAVYGNTVEANHFTGVAVASTALLTQLAGIKTSLAGIDPAPRGVTVRRNTVVHNGTSSPLPGVPGADLLWDRSGTDNHWSANVFGTSLPAALPR